MTHLRALATCVVAVLGAAGGCVSASAGEALDYFEDDQLRFEADGGGSGEAHAPVATRRDADTPRPADSDRGIALRAFEAAETAAPRVSPIAAPAHPAKAGVSAGPTPREVGGPRVARGAAPAHPVVRSPSADPAPLASGLGTVQVLAVRAITAEERAAMGSRLRCSDALAVDVKVTGRMRAAIAEAVGLAEPRLGGVVTWIMGAKGKCFERPAGNGLDELDAAIRRQIGG